MSFSTAIPASRVFVADMRFDASSQERGFQRKAYEQTQPRKQTVNISDDTLMRRAKQNLSRTVGKKMTYNQSGLFAESRAVGSLLSTTA